MNAVKSFFLKSSPINGVCKVDSVCSGFHNSPMDVAKPGRISDDPVSYHIIHIVYHIYTFKSNGQSKIIALCH